MTDWDCWLQLQQWELCFPILTRQELFKYLRHLQSCFTLGNLILVSYRLAHGSLFCDFHLNVILCKALWGQKCGSIETLPLSAAAVLVCISAQRPQWQARQAERGKTVWKCLPSLRTNACFFRKKHWMWNDRVQVLLLFFKWCLHIGGTSLKIYEIIHQGLFKIQA